MRLDDNKTSESSSLTTIRSFWTDAEKDIDDALLSGEKLYKITILDWYSALYERCRDEVPKVWESEE